MILFIFSHHQVITCTDLQTLIYCIHAFLSAKLSTVDPTFLTNYWVICSSISWVISPLSFLMYRVFFFYDPISFSCHFYTNKDIDMRSFVTCSGHRVIFFRYYMIIFWDGTKDIKRCKFQVKGCLNVITLSQDASWVRTFWQFTFIWLKVNLLLK